MSEAKKPEFVGLSLADCVAAVGAGDIKPDQVACLIVSRMEWNKRDQYRQKEWAEWPDAADQYIQTLRAGHRLHIVEDTVYPPLDPGEGRWLNTATRKQFNVVGADQELSNRGRAALKALRIEVPKTAEVTLAAQDVELPVLKQGADASLSLSLIGLSLRDCLPAMRDRTLNPNVRGIVATPVELEAAKKSSDRALATELERAGRIKITDLPAYTPDGNPWIDATPGSPNAGKQLALLDGEPIHTPMLGERAKAVISMLTPKKAAAVPQPTATHVQAAVASKQGPAQQAK